MAYALVEGWRPYVAVVPVRLHDELRYRAAALPGMATHLFRGFIRLAIRQSLYASAVEPVPMSLADAPDHPWLARDTSPLTAKGSDSEIAIKIRMGDMVCDPARPNDPYRLWFRQTLGHRVGFMLMQFALANIVALLLLGLRLLHNWPVAAASLFLLLSGLLQCGALTTLMAGSLLWRYTGGRVTRLAASVAVLLSGRKVPLRLFRDSLQLVLDAGPFHGLAGIPFRIHSGHIPLIQTLRKLASQLGWARLFAVCGRLLLARGFHHPVLQGG